MPIQLNTISDIRQFNVQDVLTQGSISLGGKTYSVAVMDDKVSVQRTDTGAMSTGQRIANGIKDFFGRLFSEGSLSTRASRLEGNLQSMLQRETTQAVVDFGSDIQLGQSFLGEHTAESFAETCIQTMSDDTHVQEMLRANLDNPLYSSERFTGIEPHPTDSSKFIAKFGEEQIEFSDRQSTHTELRGTSLREQLTHGDYQNLGDLIGKNYLTNKDSVILYAFNPAIMNLTQRMEGWPQEMRSQVIEAVSHQAIGNTTIGEAFGNRLA